MSPHFQRGMILIDQHRYDLAEREFRQELTQSPNNPLAHAFLAICFSQANRDEDALREADEAIRCGPDQPFCHYIRGRALNVLDRYDEAEAAAQMAIQLDPTDADYPGLLAAIEIDRKRWPRALAAADRGLALDPEHPFCTNLRAMALVHLGRKEEATRTLGSALADDPENAFTHANQGWALLHQGDHAQALIHFREALRIEPNLDWARAGIVEALKARFVIYRVMLGFFLWMGRQSSVAQWAVILAFIFGRQILESLSKSFPAIAPFTTPILVLSFAFLLMTWIASPLFNLTLRFNRFGRMALSREQKIESNWIGPCFFLAAGLLAGYLVSRNVYLLLLTIYFGLMLFPLAVTFRIARGRPRLLAAIYTFAAALVGATAVAAITLGTKGAFRNVGNPVELARMFAYGAVFSTWIPALFSRMSA